MIWFRSWLQSEGGLSPEELVALARYDAGPLNDALGAFGQELWREGAPYWRYAETVNACGAMDTLIRRSFGVAWDLAYSWLEEEPGNHHLPLSRPLLSAMVSLALLRGWPRVACLALIGWSGLCRPSEVIGALRRDLVLPRDVLFASRSLFLVIRNPKTRRTAARKQTARVDSCDVIALAEALYGDEPPSAPLWPASTSTFRARFTSLATALGLPTDRRHASPGFEAGEVIDLGSLRTGGATDLWLATENATLVQQRGRWANAKNMQIYLQELAATTLLSRLSRASREAVADLSGAAADILDAATQLLQSGIETALWKAHWLEESEVAV